ncbi:anti-sigma-F factor Fin [Insulibacter thermoxylanivorax]|uniref:Anti-sigma-F factor Fin n=1 Tax=Insulibacter thermoxylanivorax TaxID=2749268 RepID=A0A916QCV7_9BACL|nr:anti-sigma-F factor Fin family protein [Insulibacter thermoxylanivorax]GFR38410.1 anti-sigma-F factor Fin [Insulibacter thermoxylanivorax]
MPVIYYCRHCGTKVGEIHDDVSEYALGFHHLTPEERSEMISYQAGGEITVRVICDYCRTALETNPELSLLPNLLQ